MPTLKHYEGGGGLLMLDEDPEAPLRFAVWQKFDAPGGAEWELLGAGETVDEALGEARDVLILQREQARRIAANAEELTALAARIANGVETMRALAESLGGQPKNPVLDDLRRIERDLQATIQFHGSM